MEFTLVKKLGDNYYAVVNPEDYRVADNEWIIPFRYVFGYWGAKYERGLSGDVIKRKGADYEIWTGTTKVFTTSNSYAVL